MTADGPRIPYDLEAGAIFVRTGGTSDPDDLAYGGPLNLVGLGAGRPCSLHPMYVIGPNGCRRCRELLRVRRMLAALDGVPDLVDAYERLVVVLGEGMGPEVVDGYAGDVEALCGRLGIRFAAGGPLLPGGPVVRAFARWERPF